MTLSGDRRAITSVGNSDERVGIAAALDLADLLYIRGVGVALLGFAAMVALVARSDRSNARPALYISFADIGWVLSTTLFALAHGVTVAGAAVVLATNAFVASFALAQLVGIERSFRVTPSPLRAERDGACEIG